MNDFMTTTKTSNLRRIAAAGIVATCVATGTTSLLRADTSTTQESTLQQNICAAQKKLSDYNKEIAIDDINRILKASKPKDVIRLDKQLKGYGKLNTDLVVVNGQFFIGFALAISIGSIGTIYLIRRMEKP